VTAPGESQRDDVILTSSEQLQCRNPPAECSLAWLSEMDSMPISGRLCSPTTLVLWACTEECRSMLGTWKLVSQPPSDPVHTSS
jgi:hypothetical protein